MALRVYACTYTHEYAVCVWTVYAMHQSRFCLCTSWSHQRYRTLRTTAVLKLWTKSTCRMLDLNAGVLKSLGRKCHAKNTWVNAHGSVCVCNRVRKWWFSRCVRLLYGMYATTTVSDLCMRTCRQTFGHFCKHCQCYSMLLSARDPSEIERSSALLHSVYLCDSNPAEHLHWEGDHIQLSWYVGAAYCMPSYTTQVITEQYKHKQK